MRWKNNSISRIAGLFRKFFKPEKRTVAVEIDNDIVKVAEALGTDGSRRLVRAEEITLSREDAEPLSDAMKRLFGRSPAAGRVIDLNIPRHSLAARYVNLPSTDEGELGRIVPMESLKYIPYNAEDITCGYRVVERTPDGYSRVQLAIAEAKMINGLVRAAERAGLAVRSARAGFETLFEWYLAFRGAAQKETALVVSVDPNYIDIAVIEGDKLTFTRGVSCRASMAVGEMAEQIKMSVNAYREDSTKPIETVFVTGSLEKASQLKDALSSVFTVPVTLVDQAENPDLGAEPRIALSNASFTGLLGIALNGDKMKINLIPPGSRAFYAVGALKKSLLITACLLLAVCAAVAGITVKKLHDKVRIAAYLDAELGKVDPNVYKTRVMLDNMEKINATISARPHAIDILSESVAAAPEGIFVTTLSYEFRKTFSLRGTAPSLNDAFDYAKALEKSPYLLNVRTKYAAKRAGTNEELVDFEITGNISGDK